MHFEVSAAAQAGAEASLGSSDHVVHVVQETALGRKQYVDLALGLGCTPLPSHTNFVTIDVGGYGRAAALVGKLAEQGVFIRMPGKPPLNRCIRVTIGTAEQRARFGEIFREVVASS
jgi:histidinol-phosphate aminotransferase